MTSFKCSPDICGKAIPNMKVIATGSLLTMVETAMSKSHIVMLAIICVKDCCVVLLYLAMFCSYLIPFTDWLTDSQ